MHSCDRILPSVVHLLLCYLAIDCLSVEKGQHCNCCTFLGDIDMKHPDSSVQLAAGHLDPHTQFGGHTEAIEDWIESEDVQYVLFPGKQLMFYFSLLQY